ncbi:MAG: hypothetical protein WB647_18590, partial [Roseiarcus sp.]|uniref:hypothetical protein n=1 Tax=Roseiarcus sp. TaxID=1969460 RepID=UPI003C380A7A
MAPAKIYQRLRRQKLSLCNSQAGVSPKSHYWIEKVFAWSIFGDGGRRIRIKGGMVLPAEVEELIA